jgi:hypothetical protein
MSSVLELEVGEGLGGLDSYGEYSWQFYDTFEQMKNWEKRYAAPPTAASKT